MVATAFFAVAIFVLLRGALDMAGAAALTAVILLLLPAGWLVWKKLSPPPRSAKQENAALVMLAGMARDKPLLAVAGAALYGLAEYFLRQRNKKPRPGVLF